MAQKILSVARSIKRKCFPPKPTITEQRLENLANSCQEYIEKHHIQPKVKILWPTLFNQDQTWWAHDGILICALRLRGADIIPTMCDKLQADECMIHSGVWQGSYEPGFAERREALCNQCVQFDLKLWGMLKVKPIRLSSFLSDGERAAIWKAVEEIMSGDWESFVLDGYPVGYEAWKGVVNNHLQGEIKPNWREQANELASNHIFNILALSQAYQKVLTVMKPESVFGNGGHYYQWGVLNHLCKQMDLPYYRYYAIGLQPGSWNYALNSNEIVHLTPAWSSWIAQDFNQDKINKVKEDLGQRGLRLEKTESVQQRIQVIQEQLQLDPTKPTLLALTGVIWDASTNVKSDAFINMYEWLWATIEWFNHHPEYQLIIRVHPSENVVPSIAPGSRTMFMKELQEKNLTLSKNIFIIKPEEKVDSYDLMHLADSAAVYMSTTGLEYACLGKPLILLGPAHYSKKGFTHEPKTQEEYFSLIGKFLNQPWGMESQEQTQMLAMKYWFLYAFHASTVMGLFEAQAQNWLTIKRGMDGFSTVPKALSFEDLLPGKNEQLDYLCDSILDKLPIMGENRWPPQILDMYCKE